ncbi:MAG: MBL fold metallo-hydrolase [Candidatus Omnitrophica bacterium]|nr:MBL fold metallo-hydrolase [Candidatus Omnitrophota bacterium]MBU1997176.1 MBL fold metallo-hydrolase [Candidatus Omnitrophota bacterium]MBU4334184.1 MBL fold metallo-hydrolase [Candidatus Omnitrophota bacterium]
MKPKISVLFFSIIISFLISASSFAQDKTTDNIDFYPINHASFIIQAGTLTIHVDPVGETDDYKDLEKPEILLITHTHHDHLNVKVVKYLQQKNTTILGPKEVIDQLGFGQVIENGESHINDFNNVKIDAIPMYNTTKERLNFHKKGEGNGYVVTINDKRIYVAGDTEDIPEMRNLKNIDHAFICMNLPYTMTVEQAASAVLEFKPKNVYPYHYRGQDGMSDINKFRELVSDNPEINVKNLKWY